MWLKIKAWFTNLWLKLKGFARRFSAYWVSALAIVLMVIVGGAWLINKDAMDNNDNNRGPQIAQVFEPSIGDPLAPTTEPFDASKENPDGSPKIEEVVGGRPVGPSYGKVAGNFVAPAAGVNLASIPYTNSRLGFHTELPAGATSKEASAHSVEFINNSGSVIFTVQSYGATTESIDSIFAQITGSASETSAKLINFNGYKAVEFTSKNIPGTGLAVIANGQLFYLIGDKTNFNSFRAI